MSGKKKTLKGRPKKKDNPSPMTRKPRKPLPPVDKVNHALGTKGTDPRSPVHATIDGQRQELIVTTAVQCMEVTATTNTRPIAYLSLGIVLRAIKRGLLGSVKGPQNQPYYMFMYLNEAFRQAMEGSIPAIQQAPRWFWEICYALKKKTVSFKTGRVTYSWKIDTNPNAIDQVLTLGAGVQSYAVFLGAALSGVSINGFPVLAPVPAYTDALGEAAISNLWTFLETASVMGKMTGDPGSAYCGNDTSSFSVTFPELGSSFETSDGLKTTIYSERQIDSPIFAKFATYQPPATAYWRGWHKAGAGGGSPCYIGPRMTELTSYQEIRNKTPPIFKFYNFDEFFEVLSLTMCMAQEARESAGLLAKPCPLTSQQVQIMLRQTLIPGFCNEMAQDLRLGGSYFLEMLPFTVSQNGVQPNNTQMLLPTFLAENIRCCARLTASLRSKISESDPRQIIDYIPVLARPSPSDVPQLQNYYYSTNVLLYAAPGPEVLINLIDCSAVQGGNTVYLDLSREQLEVLVTMWNEWIAEFSNVLSPLVQVNSESGIKALSTIMYTNHCGRLLGNPEPEVQVTVNNTTTTTTTTVTNKRKSAELPKDIGLKASRKLKNVGPSGNQSDFFQTVSDKDVTSGLNFQKPIWKFLSNMILPVNINDGQLEDASLQGWQAFFIEPYALARSATGGVGAGVPGTGTLYWPQAFSRHLNMASIDTKAIGNAAQNEFIEEIVEMGKKGRGGFFTDIAALIGDAVGAPGLANVARTVGKITGF